MEIEKVLDKFKKMVGIDPNAECPENVLVHEPRIQSTVDYGKGLSFNQKAFRQHQQLNKLKGVKK